MTGEPAIAVVVQVMVAAERAGVAFTAHPVTGRTDVVVVEAAFGQGEVVVSGAVQPDTYELAATAGTPLISLRVGRQSHQIVRGPDGADQTVALAPEQAQARVLDDEEAAAIARLALRVQDHYGVPQDVEWAMQDKVLWLVQARPITTLARADQPARPLLTGLAAAPGRSSGAVRVLQSPSQGAQLRAGDVLVAPMTNPDWLPTIRRAAALVTDSGGATCHAAIVARELGGPCIVGTRYATTSLHDGQVVTVDGGAGEVLAGAAPATSGPAGPAPAAAPAPTPTTIGTRLYVNLAMPEHALAVAAGPVDGVGLLRAEFMLTDALGGRHPREVIARGEQQVFLDAMSASLLQITEAFAPPAGRLPRHRPAEQRIPRAGRWRGARARRAQPDDRLPRRLPIPA
jgi:pyruvate,water dikinase